MKLEIDIPEHHYNNIIAFDSVNLGRAPYKGIIMYAINAIKRGRVLEQEPTTKNDLVTLTFSKGTLKYSCKDYVVYKKDWLRSHYGAEIDIMFGDSQYKDPTTKNDLGVDAISRQEVLDLIADYDLSMGQVVRGIHALPSVTPQEPRWIPVSERLPEAIKNVLVTSVGGYVYISRLVHGEWEYGGEVVAWMPLPQPYKAETEEE